MYLRTTKRKNKNGTTSQYYQLAHNERDSVTKKPVARIIHSFGRADELERDALVRLCRSIARVCGLSIVDQSDEQDTTEGSSQLGVDLPQDVRLIRTVQFGAVLAIEALWDRLRIGETLRAILKGKRCQVPYERALLAMTANRLCEPQSKLGVWDRWLSKVYMPSCDGLKLDQMYEAMDFLDEHKAEIEKSVFFETANLLNLDVDLIFYDTTTVSFFIDEEDEGEGEDGDSALRKFGNPKDGVWAPQVVVALAVTREGLPVRCWVFPGNMTDVKTIERVRADLRGWKLNRALFVADSGVNSEETRKELARACGKYLLASRMASVAEIRQEVLGRRGPYKVISENLRAKEVTLGEGERRRRYILCYNPREAKRQREHRAKVMEKLRQELSRHPDKSASAQWAVELLASRRYKRYLSTTDDNQIYLDRTKAREAERYDGKWVVETNDDTITLEDAACGYKGLLVIERCFRSLKRTQIKIGPMYHWLARRIESHVRICVLALLIQRVAELACNEPWSHIKRKLNKLQISEFQTKRHSFHKRNEIDESLRETLKSLDISVPKSVLGIKALGAGPPGP